MKRPQSATEILKTASNVLGERGKQYDPAAKQERSMTAIVQAFNAIYASNGVQLTVHMGWQFMALVKMVRGATKPHADSALDQVAYAALAAESVAQQLYKPTPTSTVDALMKQIRAGYKGCPQCGADVGKEAGSCQCGWGFEEEEPSHMGNSEAKLYSAQPLCEDEGCPHHGTRHVCITSVETPEQHKERVAAVTGATSSDATYWRQLAIDRAVENSELLAHNRSLEVQLDTTHSALSDFVCRFDLTKEYMTKEQVLAGQLKHNEQVANLRHTVKAQAETISELRDEVAVRQNKLVAQQELLTTAQHNADFCLDKTIEEYATNRGLRAQLESARNSLRLSEQAADEKIQLLSNELTAKTRELCHNGNPVLELLKAILAYIGSVPSHVTYNNVRALCVEHGFDSLYELEETRRVEAPVAHNTDEPKAKPCHLLPRGGLVNPASSGSLCDASIASQPA